MKYIILLLPLISFGFDPSFMLKYTANEGFNNKSLVVIKSGEVVYSRYFEGDADTKHLLWSMSKSISSLLFGIAESKNIISREDKIKKYFKTDHNYKLKDLLYMSSGINWKEIYDKSPFNSDVVRMLYIERKKSVANYALSLSQSNKQSIHYSSGDTNIYMAAIGQKANDPLYPWTFLFDPLEIDAIFEKDNDGTFLGSSYIYMSSDGLIKIAKLILNKGLYKNKQIIPAEYINFATTINPYSQVKCEHQMSYGAQIWLNQKCENRIPLPNAPLDTITLLGYQGQSVFIIPSEDIIVVRLAKDLKSVSLNKYIESVLMGFK